MLFLMIEFKRGAELSADELLLLQSEHLALVIHRPQFNLQQILMIPRSIKIHPLLNIKLNEDQHLFHCLQ